MREGLGGGFETRFIYEQELQPWEQSEVTAVIRLRENPTPENRGRIVDEVASDGAELLDAPMTTRWEFQINDGELLTSEDEPVRDVWRRGTDAKKKRAMRDHRFWLDYQRACYEDEEQAVFEDEVLSDPSCNTLITFTPYAQDQEEAFGPDFIDKETHYKRDRKLGFIRILYGTSPTTAEVVSISVENSHELEAFYAVANGLGHEMPKNLSPTDMLGQHMKTFVDPDERLAFERKLVNIFDQKLGELLGGQYTQGRAKGASLEAYTFVLANQDILAVYTTEVEKIALQGLSGRALLKAMRRIRYSYLATLYDRYQTHDHDKPLLIRIVDSGDYVATYNHKRA